MQKANGNKRDIFKPRLWDMLILAVPVIIAVVSLLFFLPNNNGGAVAKIIVDGKVQRTIDLTSAKDQTVDLSLPYHNIIEVKNGKIGIISADCKDKTCIRSGYISSSGQVVACVPSGLIIVIESDDGADAVTG